VPGTRRYLSWCELPVHSTKSQLGKFLLKKVPLHVNASALYPGSQQLKFPGRLIHCMSFVQLCVFVAHSSISVR
jgi:hypothetical protein